MIVAIVHSAFKDLKFIILNESSSTILKYESMENQPSRGVSSFGATVILVNCSLGIGLITITYAYTQFVSVLALLGIQLLVCALSAVSLIALGYCAIHVSANPTDNDEDAGAPLLGGRAHITYANVCGRFGSRTSFLASFVVLVYTFIYGVIFVWIVADMIYSGVCNSHLPYRQLVLLIVAFWILISLNLNTRFSKCRLDLYVIPSLYGLFMVIAAFSLAAVKFGYTNFFFKANADNFTNSSTANKSTMFTTITDSSTTNNASELYNISCIKRESVIISEKNALIPNSGAFYGFLSVAYALCVAFNSHAVAIPVLRRLESRRFSDWVRVVLASSAITSLIFALFAVLRPYEFQQNDFLSFWLFFCIICAITLKINHTQIVNYLPGLDAFSTLMDLILRRGSGHTFYSTKLRVIFFSVWFLLTLGTAELLLYPSARLVHLIGSMCSLLMFFFPGLALFAVWREKDELENAQWREPPAHVDARARFQLLRRALNSTRCLAVAAFFLMYIGVALFVFFIALAFHTRGA